MLAAGWWLRAWPLNSANGEFPLMRPTGLGTNCGDIGGIPVHYQLDPAIERHSAKDRLQSFKGRQSVVGFFIDL